MKRKIIFVVDGEVGCNFTFEDSNPDGTINDPRYYRNAAMVACLLSNPEIIEIDPLEVDEDNLGWKYIGGKLERPTTE